MPKKSSGEIRNMRVQVRVTPAEYALIETRALQAGLPLADYVRSMLLAFGADPEVIRSVNQTSKIIMATINRDNMPG